jgi:hypothetical protein
MKHKFSIAASLALILAMLVTSAAMAAVWADQYGVSGGPVTISGDNSDGVGYLIGETVHVDVSGPNGYTAACNRVVADEDGEWSCQVTPLAGGEYTYTAVGLSSNVSQSGTFTNAVHYGSNLNIVGLTPTTVAAGGTITWSAAASCAGPVSACIPVPDDYAISLLEFSGLGCRGEATEVSSGSGSNTGNLTFNAPSTVGTYSFRARHQTQDIGVN